MSSGAVVLAEPADQAATATPTAAPATPSCVPPPQGIVLTVQNPQPGASLSPGSSVVIDGVAYDQSSTSGAGISSVTAYLGDRNAGGIFLGTATLGQPNPGVGSNSPFASAGFTLRSATLPTGSGGRSIFVYAHSSLVDREASVQIPVFLGPVPTPVKGAVPTAVLPTPAPCTPTPTAVPTATATPTAAAVVPAAAAATATPAPAAAAVPTVVLPTLAPLPPAAPAVPTPTLRPVATTSTTSSTTTTTTTTTVSGVAPRGGGIPSELGLPLLAIGALVFGGGYALRRRK
jgi:hypothetical protein